jgi:hypothetical protein
MPLISLKYVRFSFIINSIKSITITIVRKTKKMIRQNQNLSKNKNSTL